MKKFFYRVKTGDSVLSISSRFNLSVRSLILKNNLTCEVEAGDMLCIEVSVDKPYFVNPTDTAKSVAEKFGVSEEELLSKNGVPYLFYGLTIRI